jgi:lipopolysaccharide/colanic/teichoic acid biosynthesis glycosyltransferase
MKRCPIRILNKSVEVKLMQNTQEIGSYGLDPVLLESLFAKRVPLWKRGMDIVISFCGLILLSPLFLFIASLIKTVSPGPVLFKQQRVGRGGKLFTCLKFRTMKCDANLTVHKDYLTQLIRGCHSSCNLGAPMEKLKNDSRIIKHGNLLRVTGLDELPQLVNVLMGHMSLVGPRPSVPYEVAQYQPWHKARFDVVPGLTGLWQVSGKNKLGFNEMIRLDISYAKRFSLLLDCWILLMTPYAVLLQLIELLYRHNMLQLTSIPCRAQQNMKDNGLNKDWHDQL